MVKRKKRSAAPVDADKEWLDRLSRCSSAVTAWRERAMNPEFAVPGSSLHADEVPGLLSVETTAWYSMCVASEHLDFTLDAMRATATMYPTAYFPAVRTAFMGAVNALYLLAGKTRVERQSRVLRMRADELRAHIVGLKDMALPEGKPDVARTEFIDQLRDRQASLQQAAVAIGNTEDVSRMKFNQTGVVNWVSKYMLDHSDDPMIAGAFQTIWRDGSAAAHGQLQYAIMRMHQNETVSREGGNTVVHMRGNLSQDVGPAFVGTVLVLNECFRLYDLRRMKH